LAENGHSLPSTVMVPNVAFSSVVAMMLPYTVAAYVVWTVLLVLWYLLGIPLGV